MLKYAALFLISVFMPGSAGIASKTTLPYAEKITIAEIEAFIAKGIDPASTDPLGRTLLHCAAATGSLDLVKKVVALKPDLKAVDNAEGNALTWAVYGGNLQSIRFLRKLGIPYSPHGLIWIDTVGRGAYFGSTLNCAAGRTRVAPEILRYLIDSCKAGVNELEQLYDGALTGWTPTHWAVRSNDTAKLGYLIACKANISICSSEGDQTPVMLSITQKNSACLQLLRKHGATLAYDSANECRVSPMMILMYTIGIDSAVTWALKAGLPTDARLSKEGEISLLQLAAAGSARCFDTIFSLTRGHLRPEEKSEALVNAVYHCKPGAVEKICATGVDSELKNRFSSSSLEGILELYKPLLPGAGYKTIDSLPQQTCDSLLAVCLGILDRYSLSLWKTEKQRIDFFSKCLTSRFTRCASAIIDLGFSVKCIQDDEKDLFSYALASNDSTLIAKLAKAGVLITPKSFESNYGEFPCPIIRQGVAIARSQQRIDTNYEILSAAINASAQSGCLDLVTELYPLVLAASARAPRDEDFGNVPLTDSILSLKLIDNALSGTGDETVIKYLLGKKPALSGIASVLGNMQNVRRLDPEVFDLLKKPLSKKQKKTVDSVLMEDVGSYDLSTNRLIGYLFSKIRKNEPTLVNFLDKSKGHDYHYSDSGLKKLGFPSTKREKELLTAINILHSDTTAAAALVKSGCSLPAHGIANRPLLEECILMGAADGCEFLRHHGATLSPKALKKVFVEFFTPKQDEGSPSSTMYTTQGIRIIEMLFSWGADPSWCLPDGTPIISSLLDQKKHDYVKSFITHGASPRSFDFDGYTALAHTIDEEYSDTEFVTMLLSKGADPHIFIDTTKRLKETGKDSIRYERRSYPSDFLRENAGATPLLASLRKEKFIIARRLIDAGADVNKPDAEGCTPLMEAARKRYTAICSLLIAKGAQPDVQTNEELPKSALGIALEQGCDSCARMLIGYYKKLSMLPADRMLLNNACARNLDLTIVKELIALGCDVNNRDDHGQSPIFQTIVRGGIDDSLGRKRNRQVFDYLKGKADLGAVDNDGNNLLMYAITEVDTSKVSFLLTLPKLINGKDHDGRTPLMRSVIREDTQTVRLLLKNNAGIGQKDHDGNTALHHAVERNDTTTAMLLLRNHADINAKNNEGWAPFSLAVKNDKVALVKLFLTFKPDLRTSLPDGQTLLHWAATNQDRTLTSACLAARLDVNAKNAKGETPLFLVAGHKTSADFPCLLIKAGADPSIANHENESLMHILAKTAVKFPCIDRLVAAMKEIDIPDNEGRTPLMVAAMADADLFDLLLAKGAGVDLKDNAGKTPLMMAVKRSMNDHIIKLLKLPASGSFVNLKDNDGRDALMTAAINDNYIGAALLLKAGASVKTVDNNGGTALRFAIANGNPSMIILLRKQGAVLKGTKERIRELLGSELKVEDSVKIFDATTLPLDKLPAPPAADFSSIEGYWWHKGTIPLHDFKSKECIVIKEDEKTLETTDEVLKFSPYQAKILRSETTSDFGLSTGGIFLCGEWMHFKDNSARCTMTRDGSLLTICNPDRETCEVYQYLGLSFDETKFEQPPARQEGSEEE
jgi:ankyrin repeat protein